MRGYKEYRERTSYEKVNIFRSSNKFQKRMAPHLMRLTSTVEVVYMKTNVAGTKGNARTVLWVRCVPLWARHVCLKINL